MRGSLCHSLPQDSLKRERQGQRKGAHPTIFHPTRILEWGAIPLSRRSSQPRNRRWISCTASGFSAVRATRKALWFSTIQSAPQGSYPFAHFLCPAHSWCYILLESHSTVLALSVRVSEAAAVQTRPWPAGSSRGLHWGELSGLPRGHVSST